MAGTHAYWLSPFKYLMMKWFDNTFKGTSRHKAPQAPDRFNPKVRVQTCGIIQKLYETKHIETMMFGKSVIALFSKIEPKTSK